MTNQMLCIDKNQYESKGFTIHKLSKVKKMNKAKCPICQVIQHSQRKKIMKSLLKFIGITIMIVIYGAMLYIGMIVF